MFLDDMLGSARFRPARPRGGTVAMSASVRSSTIVGRLAHYNKGRLLFVSSLALTTAGIAASLRANTASDLQRIFLDPLNKAHSAEMIGGILGIPFLGFAVTIAIGSPLLDTIGMGLLLPLAGLFLGGGALVFAGQFATGMGVYNSLWLGALLAGVGWGLVPRQGGFRAPTIS
jgi:hypothetical protein